MSWRIDAIELPFGDTPVTWWLGDSGVVGTTPTVDAEPLRGRYVLRGLVDSHAHPTAAAGAHGPVPAGEAAARATLRSWAEAGVTVVRDLGSPGGQVLDLLPTVSAPRVLAAGRFLAPEGRYFPALLREPVEADDLVTAALAEVARGATWVKIIGDFPLVPEFTDNALTYPMNVVADVTAAAHAAGARVAVHTVLPGAAGQFVAAGVDSIEHGPGLDSETLRDMAQRGVAWTPTLCALFGLLDDSTISPERRESLLHTRDHLTEQLPEAVRLGVPVLAGTDVAGTLAREVALLARFGIDPKHALAAASQTARDFLGETSNRGDLVTYQNDPRDDPSELDRPLAVIANGIRLR
ncbi:MAG: amidohydrolase family protein [Mycobacteriales bacterium]